MRVRCRKISEVTDKLSFGDFVQAFRVLTKFLWLQNTDHGWPILLVFRFSKISMLRFFKKENSLVTVALENHFPLNLILVQERIASGDQISCFMKTSIMKFYHWLEVNIYRRFSCHASNKFCQ